MTTPKQKEPSDEVVHINLAEPLTIVTTETQTITSGNATTINLAEPLTMVTTETQTITSGPKPKKEKKITLDSQVDRSDWGRYRTPGALTLQVSDGDRLFRSATKKITSKKVKFDKFGRIDVDSLVTGGSLHLKIQITCNPEYMCQPHDLVPVLLETSTDVFVFTIALLEPTPEQNFFQIDVEYSLAELAAALHVPLGRDDDPLAVIQEEYPELGIKAQWLADTTGGGNQANHVSGGVFEKGGSGRVILRPRKEQDFVDTFARVRNTEWNMAERLTPGRARPVYLAFHDILAEGEELATTIEAESEFMCTPTQLAHVIGTMDELVEKAKVTSLDLMETLPTSVRDRIITACPTLVEMKHEVKEYIDTYYDIDGSGSVCPLMRNKIVLRRRHVGSDPEGTFLFTLKGATRDFTVKSVLGDKKEVLRYAAQVNLVEELALKPEGMLRVRDLMCDTANLDNAFARCFQQALATCGQSALIGAKDSWILVPKLKVTSTRHKYSMKFSDNTVLEFSADTAVGTLTSGVHEPVTVCSFELGVGHPGLSTAGTTTFLSMAGQIAFWDQPGSFDKDAHKQKAVKKQKRLITRPFHVWEDVCNDRMLYKTDFTFYALVRHVLLDDHFRIDLSELTRGGNKGSVLAKLLGLLG